jgi:hypothetical protein
LRDVVSGLFTHFEPTSFDLDDANSDRLSALATLTARCRSAVERDSYRREIELIPGSERPARLVLSLARLYQGMKNIGVAKDECWRLLTSVGMDSIPAVRAKVFEALRKQKTLVSTTDVAQAIDYPTGTARRALEELMAHQIATKESGGRGEADRWQLTENALTWYAMAGFPEKSEDAQGTLPEMSVDGVQGGVPEMSVYGRQGTFPEMSVDRE